MQVRTLKKEDVDEVRELILSILTREYPFDRSAYSDSDLYDLMGTYNGVRDGFFVLEDAGKIIGTVGIKEDSKEVALLRRLFVEASSRQKGYGSLLMDQALLYCKKKGYHKIVFRTTNRMIQAIELCIKKGFNKEEQLDLEGFQIYKFARLLVG